MARRKRSEPALYQLKVTLEVARPPVWRRLEVRSDATLEQMHTVLQIAFGWEDDHLHQFVVGDVIYGPLEVPDVLDEGRARLHDVLTRPRQRMVYEYDFGDDWRHVVALEAIEPMEPGMPLARCTGGRRRGPPEDIGGPWRYGYVLEVLRDPEHPEYEELREWMGDDIDLEEFDAETVSAVLASVA